MREGEEKEKGEEEGKGEGKKKKEKKLERIWHKGAVRVPKIN